MIERIDLFMPPKSRYQVLHHFTLSMADAFKRMGIRCRILEPQKENSQEFLNTFFTDLPQCTLSFNGLLPDEQGRFFCDVIKIPHIACLVDAPQHFLALTHSPHTIITNVDRSACDFFQGVHPRNVLFMPHAVNRELIIPPSDEKRDIDILLLASFIDSESIHKEWEKNLPKLIVKALERAAETVLTDRDTSYVQALVQELDAQMKLPGGIYPHSLDMISILDQLEDYINGKDRLELVKALQGHKIHIYGEGSEQWKKALPHAPHLIIEKPVAYDEAIKIMRRSKIVLNSCPSIKHGAHERIFAGIASGAVVLTNENPFLLEYFKHGKNILFYRPGQWETAHAVVQEYLKDSRKQQELVKRSQQVVQDAHTWDHRAAILIEEITPILEQMRVF